jgi:hypothetical protein
VTNLDALTGHAAVNLVGMSPRWPGRIVWFENPMVWGGSPRTNEWRSFEIGPAYGTEDTFVTYASADLNWDGRMDLVTARSEGDENPPIGELVWWEAPEDYHSGAWIKHVIDPTYTSAHNIRIADMNSDGAADIVTAEQEQSPRDRVSIFFNDGAGNFTELVLSTGSGHNLAVEDLDGDGDMDILNAGHGFYDAPHPVEIYVNRPL